MSCRHHQLKLVDALHLALGMDTYRPPSAPDASRRVGGGEQTLYLTCTFRCVNLRAAHVLRVVARHRLARGTFCESAEVERGMWQMQPRSVLIEIATNIIGRPRYTNVTRTVPCRLCCVLGYMATEVPRNNSACTDIGIEREEATSYWSAYLLRDSARADIDTGHNVSLG
jgi:hypothetical protein